MEKKLPILLFTEHHHSHAASAFYASPFKRAAVLCMDGVGEWVTTSVWTGEDNRLISQRQIKFPNSLGLLYSAFTYFCGFKVNSGEYKLMGLAPYGEPRYVNRILENIIDLREDGTFRLNMEYFGYLTGLKMINEKFERLFKGPPRKSDDPITEREMDIARSIQIVTEEVVLRLGRTIRRETGEDYLTMAGGVSLNCVANSRLMRAGLFRDIWVQPASGDAGGALGAALAIWFDYLGNNRDTSGQDMMKGCYLGPSYTDGEIKGFLDRIGARYPFLDDEELIDTVATLLSEQKVIGWFQGRMECGPRALGNRSILGDPRNPEMQSIMNLKIKFRESFRPFAPAVCEGDMDEYFDWDRRSPYMLFVAEVVEKKRILPDDKEKSLKGIDKLKARRSTIPSVTHLDYTARLQTVKRDQNPRFYALIKRFKKKTGCGIVINTSFNVKDEPIVCTPEDAYRCFMKTGMDYLVIGNFLLDKSEQTISGDSEKCNERGQQRRGIISLRRIYKAWLRFSMVLGRINSYIVLSLVFFFVIFPVSIFKRIFGRKDSQKDKGSYREKNNIRPVTDMEKPY